MKKNKIKIVQTMRISVVLLILTAVVVSGCKLQQAAAPEQVTLLGEEANPSEQAVDSGLEELNELENLTEETDLGLDELEKIDLE